MYRTVKSIEIWPRNQAKTVRKLVRGIFQVVLGEFKFLINYKTQLKILRGHNRQWSYAKYILNTCISQMTYLVMAVPDVIDIGRNDCGRVHEGGFHGVQESNLRGVHEGGRVHAHGLSV